MSELTIKIIDKNIFNNFTNRSLDYSSLEYVYIPKIEFLQWLREMNINLKYHAEGSFLCPHELTNSRFDTQKGVWSALRIKGSIRKFDIVFESQEDLNIFKLTWM